MTRFIFLFGLLALACSAFAADSPKLELERRAPDFELKDQFGREWKLADLEGGVVVVVAANPKSGRAMGPWVDNLKTKYEGKVHILSLMDLHTVPGIGRGFARGRIKKETKDPVMLDFWGPTSKAYLVNNDNPVVVVIAQKGLSLIHI